MKNRKKSTSNDVNFWARLFPKKDSDGNLSETDYFLILKPLETFDDDDSVTGFLNSTDLDDDSILHDFLGAVVRSDDAGCSFILNSIPFSISLSYTPEIREYTDKDDNLKSAFVIDVDTIKAITHIRGLDDLKLDEG